MWLYCWVMADAGSCSKSGTTAGWEMAVCCGVTISSGHGELSWSRRASSRASAARWYSGVPRKRSSIGLPGAGDWPRALSCALNASLWALSLRSAFSRFVQRSSMSDFSFWSASASSRLRSLDDWAARRLRRTRSILRCSFSASVLARFLDTIRRDKRGAEHTKHTLVEGWWLVLGVVVPMTCAS